MIRPLVSVAIATWNGERYLREQLDSVLAQTHEPLEVVVSDDASTDGTTAILEDYARRAGLRYAVNAARLGLVKNFERAISMAQGEYVALADQDDRWKPFKIERLVSAIGTASLIYGNVQEVMEADGSSRLDPAIEPILRFQRAHGSGRPTRYLLTENWVVSHSLMFRRQILEYALPIPAHQPFHDGWLALVASKLGGIVFLDECLQVYRRHDQSFTFKHDPQPAEGALSRLVTGRFARAWRGRCESEVARLSDALELPLLDSADRAFAQHLIQYYSSGLRPGERWAAFRSGLRVAPFVSTLFGRPRWTFPLRALFAAPEQEAK